MQNKEYLLLTDFHLKKKQNQDLKNVVSSGWWWSLKIISFSDLCQKYSKLHQKIQKYSLT